MVLRLLALVLTTTLAFDSIAHDGDGCDRPDSPGFAEQLARNVQANCPNNQNLGTLCSNVNDSFRERAGHINFYRYQTQIYNAACVLDNDNEAQIQAKVQAFWNRFGMYHDCLTTAAGGRPLNLLKIAVFRRNSDFIDDAVLTWKVNLNRIDPTDNKTVLDFVADEIQRVRGTPFESQLRIYERRLRSGGAKYRREL
jgi:hypothetical protein